jgi:recombination protein RecA
MSGGALTAATTLVLEAQVAAEPCAWVSRPESTFFPPDLERSGVDLDALVVVFVSSAGEAARSASRLVRSGAFGLVVLDLGASSEIAMPLESRLAGLAREHDAAIVMLTEKDASAPSVGSMISLRMEAQRIRAEGEGSFRLRLTALKDKRRGPGWTHDEVVHGPAGLR